MKYIIGLLAMLLPILSGAQQPLIRPLTIGDKVPDITITNVYNYPASTIHLSALKGKLVILDFWSTWCGACIETFPKMQHLQAEFGDRLQVILVNSYKGDDIKKVNPFFQKWKARTGEQLSIPYSLLQSSLEAYFPFKFIPHYVWINRSGKVVAITSQTEVTAQNVKNAIEKNGAELHVKKDFINFSANIPLFVNNNGGSGNEFLYRSVFTRYIEGLGNVSGMERDSNEKIIRFYMYNNSPLMLLRMAYPGSLIYPSNRTIIEAKNKSWFQPDAVSGNLLYENACCYELIIPPSTTDEFQHYLREDLERYLGVKVIKEYREMKCLVLHEKNSLGRIASKGGEPHIEINETSITKFIRDQPVSAMAELLNHLPLFHTIPVLDETHFTGNIDMELPTDLYDLSLASLKSFLQKNGLELSEMERKIKVAVITNK